MDHVVAFEFAVDQDVKVDFLLPADGLCGLFFKEALVVRIAQRTLGMRGTGPAQPGRFRKRSDRFGWEGWPSLCRCTCDRVAKSADRRSIGASMAATRALTAASRPSVDARPSVASSSIFWTVKASQLFTSGSRSSSASTSKGTWRSEHGVSSIVPFSLCCTTGSTVGRQPKLCRIRQSQSP